MPQRKPEAIQQEHQKHFKLLSSGRHLEALVLSSFKVPEQVEEFKQFEELSKSFEIEQPFVPRTRVELLFEVYDGKKSRQPYGSMDDDEAANDQSSALQMDCSQLQDQQMAKTTGSLALPASIRRSSYVGQHIRIATTARPNQIASSKQQVGLSWCKTLFAKRKLGCCLRPSDTHQELGLISASSSFVDSQQQQQQQVLNNQQQIMSDLISAASSHPILMAAQVALKPGDNESEDSRQLKLEALRLIEGALFCPSSSLRQSLSPEHQSALANGLQLQAAGSAALALESAQMESSGACVSVCLLDKRHYQTIGSHDLSESDLDNSAGRNGRLWARAAARLVALRRRLRKSASLKLAASLERAAAEANKSPSAKQPNSPSNASTLIRKQLDRLARKTSRKFWSELAASANDDAIELELSFKRSRKYQKQSKRSSNNGKVRRTKLDQEQLNELVELVKGSLNQLIDAQLLLRNKLTLGADQTSSLLAAQQIRAAEYETLLRNNFNLLKIWQNLEETKRLVCFVCEPIRANLADLFAFNRQRLDWASASSFESSPVNGNTLMTTNENGTSSRHLLLVSPLVSVDAVQLKRGLLQILEALNFLHAICKLIHRNLTPKNILICQNDNWKLSGLEFAVRFESTTISESASMMANEFAQALGPMFPSHNVGRPATPASKQLHAGHHHNQHSSTSGQTSLGATGLGSGGGIGSGALHLRRQRTLPDMDYLAPEMMRHSRCSHKSDLFSFGLILGQTYDLCQHKPAISCNSRATNYESELKKLDERRKFKLARLVPCEMDGLLLELLDLEPNLRPSANHVLQLLRRPVELCQTSEESLRHLRNSLTYLDNSAKLKTAVTSNGQQVERAAGGAEPKRAPVSYFRRVTSAAANREPASRQQTRNLQLLNQLVRAIDSMANPSHCLRDNQPDSSAELRLHQCTTGNGARQPSAPFCTLRLQFEQTLELLREAFKCGCEFGEPNLQLAPGQWPNPRCAPLGRCDSRSLLLIVALHRRLLEQVAHLRAELPPVCMRLNAANGQQAPLDRNLASANHRALADIEERLRLIVSKQSMGRLSQWLADPLLKLDEFLLVFELINDLVGFLGQRCKLNYVQRGKQLLSELTPLTGCSVLSSSSEDEDEDEEQAIQAEALTQVASLADFDPLDETNNFMHQQHLNYADSSGQAACRGRDLSPAARPDNRLAHHNQQQHRFDSNMAPSSHQNYFEDKSSFNALEGNQNISIASQQQQQQHQQRRALSRPGSRQEHLFQLPTSINITAPSPMGSVRDISRASLASSTPTEGSMTCIGQQQMATQATSTPLASSVSISTGHKQQQQQQQTICAQTNGRGSFQYNKQFQQLNNFKRHSHQDVTTRNAQSNISMTTDYLCEQTSQMTLDDGQFQQQQQHQVRNQQFCDYLGDNQDGSGQFESSLSNSLEPANQLEGNDQHDSAAAPDEKSRSKLIDELLKTINDDSFNDFIDLNNKLNQAASRSQANPEFAHTQRPKSAIGAVGAGSGSSQMQSDTGPANHRPRTLNLNNNSSSNINPTASSTSARYQTRGSVCVNQTSQQTSTFDNVIRRMSTNFVQNFNKMSGTNANNLDQANQLDCNSSNTNLNLRREKSSTSTYANSLYVDTSQVPARRHSDNTINVPRIQVALSSPSSATSGSRTNLNQRASLSASKLANKWKLSAKTNQREASDKLSPNLGGALGYMRRHSSGNTNNGAPGASNGGSSSRLDQQGQSNGGLGVHLLNASPFKQTKSSSNLGLDFLLSNRSMKRRCSAASMLGHQTQRKAEDLLDAGMKSVQNMFS